MDENDKRRLDLLRKSLNKEETWALGKLQPSDLAFVIRLLDANNQQDLNTTKPVGFWPLLLVVIAVIVANVIFDICKAIVLELVK